MAGPTGGISKVRTDLVYYGVVTRVISATQFIAAGLAGLGDGALVGYGAYVLAKVDGTVTPPHAEQPAVTAYVSSSGTFTHVAYTATLAVGDQLLLLHPNISSAVPAALATIIASIAEKQGLCYYGVVTDVPVAGQFTIATLAGMGAFKFATVVPEYQYHAFVLRDGAGGGAAPQGESQPVTNYATLTGNFTANAFTMPVGIDDEILIIHPFLARIMNFAGLPPITGATAANWQLGEANIVLVGGDNVSYKLHTLELDITGLIGTITIRIHKQISGAERLVYQHNFTVIADGPGLWIVNGTVGIHEVLRVTAQSDNAADNLAPISYDYMLEAM